jgi:hypothetical protein
MAMMFTIMQFELFSFFRQGSTALIADSEQLRPLLDKDGRLSDGSRLSNNIGDVGFPRALPPIFPDDAIVCEVGHNDEPPKVKFFVEENPPSELIAMATAKVENARMSVPSGELCAFWESHSIKPHLHYFHLRPEKRDRLYGLFQKIPSGLYRVDLYNLLPPTLPPPPPSSQESKLTFVEGCLGIAFLAASLTAGLVLLASPVAPFAYYYFDDWRWLLLLIPLILILALNFIAHFTTARSRRTYPIEQARRPPDVVAVLHRIADDVSSKVAPRVVRPGEEPYLLRDYLRCVHPEVAERFEMENPKK